MAGRPPSEDSERLKHAYNIRLSDKEKAIINDYKERTQTQTDAEAIRVGIKRLTTKEQKREALEQLKKEIKEIETNTAEGLAEAEKKILEATRLAKDIVNDL